MLGVLREANPALSQAHVLNEVSGHWPWTNHTGIDYANFFVDASRAINSVTDDFELGGPVDCCTPSGQPWDNYSVWTRYGKPLIDAALPRSDLKFYDFHSYDRFVPQVLGELSLVTGYAWVTHSKQLRSAITETNFGLNHPQFNLTAYENRSLHWRIRTAPLASQTLALLAVPDKVFARHVFDLLSPTGKPNKMDVDSPEPNGGGRPTPEVELFAAFRILRGSIVKVDTSDGTPLNEGSTATNVQLTGTISRALVKQAFTVALDVAGARHLSTPLLPGDTVPLPSLGVLAIQWILPHVAVTRVTDFEEEWCRGVFNLQIDTSPHMPFHCNMPAARITREHTNNSAAVRFGMKGPGATSTWQVLIQGEPVGLAVQPGFFYEMPMVLSASITAAKPDITFEFSCVSNCTCPSCVRKNPHVTVMTFVSLSVHTSREVNGFDA
eukprot:COSAG01_NODE_1537_length_9986_cov_28.165672_1_plen_439_part_00